MYIYIYIYINIYWQHLGFTDFAIPHFPMYHIYTFSHVPFVRILT